MTSFTPAQKGLSRVFLIEGRARPDHTPDYQSCLVAGAPSQAMGDVEKIECPDPNEYGKWTEIGSVRGAEERVSLSLTGRYALDVKSELLRLAKKGCSVDVQVNFGQCEIPNAFDLFAKKMILEDAILTNWEAEELGALASGDNAKVDETAEVSAKNIYEIVPLSYARKGDDVVTNEVVDVVICDSITCGTCQDESDGCKKIYAITKAAGGSAGTPADVVFSLDKGQNFYAHDIDAWGAAVDGAGIACVGKYVVAIATDASDPMAYATKSDITPINDETWTDSTTGFVAAGTPRAIWSYGAGAFVVGSAGYIYQVTDPTAGVTVLDAGTATTQNLLSVHGLDSSFAVAVGSNGAIVATEDGSVWALVTPTNISFAATNIQTIAVRTKTHWQIGTSGGRAYYTLDGGVTFYQMAFPGNGTGQVTDIQYSTDSVGFMAHQTTLTKGRVLRTYSNGNSWIVTPEGTSLFVAVDKVSALAACENDPNFVVAVGLDDNAADGFIALGQG